MSLKSIELQQVLPKSVEISKVQHGMQHHPMIEEDIKIKEAKKKEIEKNKKTNKMEQSLLQENNTTRTPNRNMDKTKGRYIDIQL